MKVKKFLFILILLLNTLLNGCMGAREINTLGIAISLGIDRTDGGYQVSYQVLNPRAFSTKSKTPESPVILYTSRGEDLFDTIRSMATQSPRKIYNSHLRMVVIGETAARDGIQEMLDFLIRDQEFRTDFYFVVAKGSTANHILQIMTPLESTPGLEMYTSLETLEKSWPTAKPIKIIQLVKDIISDGKNPILSGVEVDYENAPNPDSVETLKNIKNSKIKIRGIGAFKRDRLEGWLTEEESLGYNYIAGNVKDTTGSVQLDNNNRITYEVTEAKSKKKVSVQNGRPAVNVQIHIKYNIAAQIDTLDVSKEEIVERISKKVEENITAFCEATLKRLQNDLKTDILGFGEDIHRHDPKLWRALEGDWDKEFTDLPVKITIDAEVDNLGNDTKSVFLKGKG